MTFVSGTVGNPTMRKWAQQEDVRAIACAVLGISAPEAAQRYLPGRTAEAINMRLTHIRKRYPDDGTEPVEAINSRNLLIAILKWAANNDRIPPGMSYIQMEFLCREHGVEMHVASLKQRSRARAV